MKKTFLFLTVIFVSLIFLYFLSHQSSNSIKYPTSPLSQIIKIIPTPNATPTPNTQVSLIAVGDIMLSRTVAQKIKQNGSDYPFAKVSSFLQSADLLFANLETPLTEGRAINSGEMLFRADPALAQTLKKHNFSILSLANNHTPNFGNKGLLDTFQYLSQAGIKYVGAGENQTKASQAQYIEKNGIKFAFLAYNNPDVVPSSYFATPNSPGTNPMNLDNLKSAIKTAKQNADFVIVSMHSGNEYVNNPNQSQTNFAHTAIDAGAQIVIGHHPHTIQILEKYKNKFIFYSLGNFIFDQMWSQQTREGLAIKILFNQQEIEKIDLIPVLINDYCQPQIITDQTHSEKILKRLNYDLTKLF
ncbi:CapA family protein [Patescibacteria group bacterium]|nr:CapA family protein [Patescibacteria group bacterium]